MSELFPIIQPDAEAVQTDRTLPLCRECAWDFEQGRPLFRRGEPVVVSGREAVAVWCWKALLTERTRWEIYSWNFGSEVETLIGHNFTGQTKQAEAARYVREALEINPYVTAVREIAVDFSAGRLAVSATVQTIYGEVSVSV